jgi:phage repressor protein C with HTH and peptisase S24 domain
MRGCYVYFVDKEVEAFFRSRMKMDGIDTDKQLFVSDIVKPEDEDLFHVEDVIEKQLQYKEYLPMYGLEAACGLFGRGTDAEPEGWVKVSGVRLNKNMFVSRVVGESMEPLIPAGSHCIFQANVIGSRNGKIVLVQSNTALDADTGGKYAVKKYMSKKKYADDSTWQHDEIALLSLNPKYEPIMISNSEEGEFIVIAEFIAVLKTA